MRPRKVFAAVAFQDKASKRWCSRFDEAFAIPSGEVNDLVKLQADEANAAASAEETVWIGGIPSHLVIAKEEGEPAQLAPAVMQQLRSFGQVDMSRVTVRVKPGENRCWALVTFQSPDSSSGVTAEAACANIIEKALTVSGSEGEPLQLTVKRSDVSHKLHDSSGALAMMALAHSSHATHGQPKPVSTQSILRVLRYIK